MSAITLALFHALRADLALASHSTGLRLEALVDAANHALPQFRLNSAGEAESLSGETAGDWVVRLRDRKPFYFHPSPEDDTPVRNVHGKVGDGQAMARLANSNGGTA